MTKKSFTLGDYLVAVLSAHADFLNEMSAIIGPDATFMALEDVGQIFEGVPFFQEEQREYSNFFSDTDRVTDPYAHIEGLVQAKNLATQVEFHLWAYPYYRQWVEGSTGLHHEVNLTEYPKAIEQLTETAINAMNQWSSKLTFAEPFKSQILKLLHPIQTRMRNDILKFSGKSRLSLV